MNVVFIINCIDRKLFVPLSFSSMRYRFFIALSNIRMTDMYVNIVVYGFKEMQFILKHPGALAAVVSVYRFFFILLFMQEEIVWIAKNFVLRKLACHCDKNTERVVFLFQQTILLSYSEVIYRVFHSNLFFHCFSLISRIDFFNV